MKKSVKIVVAPETRNTGNIEMGVKDTNVQIVG